MVDWVWCLSPPDDIILNLQQQSPDENIYLGKVTMSPQHAKQFAYLLLN